MQISHITILTRDVDKSAAFYQEVAGLQVRTDMKGNPRMKMLFLQDKDGGPMIELIENPNAPACNGVTLAFHVADLDAQHAVLTEKGYAPKPIISPVPNVRFFFMSDPNGVSIQFM